MKTEIQPNFEKTTITCACGNVFEVGSTKKDLKVDICSACHPHFTGAQKFQSKGGRSEQFKKKYNLA